MNPTIRCVEHENRRRHSSALRPIAPPQQGEAIAIMVEIEGLDQ
jgi:hypothetical protein